MGYDIFGATIMTQATVTIPIDPETEKAFSTVPADEKRKLELLLSLRLRELTVSPSKSLTDVMNEIGAKAEARGMTPAILDALLNGK